MQSDLKASVCREFADIQQRASRRIGSSVQSRIQKQVRDTRQTVESQVLKNEQGNGIISAGTEDTTEHALWAA